MTLDEISVRFTADISPFAAAATQAASLLSAMGSQASSLAGQFHSAGAMAGDGLRSGILSRQGAVVAAAHAIANAAAAALRSALSIHSPSRLTFEVGQLFDEGLLRGISQSAGQVEKEADLLGHRAASALQIPEFQQPFSFSAPMPSLPLFLPLLPIRIFLSPFPWNWMAIALALPQSKASIGSRKAAGG